MSKNTVVAVYPAHRAAEDAVKELGKSGFDLKKLSIIARDYQTDEHVVGYYNMGDRAKAWGKTGAFWGGLWGMLIGSAFFWVPGIGPLLVAGPFVSAIVGGMEGAVVMGGLGAIGGAFAGMGVPKDSVLRYETALKVGKVVLIVHGTPEDADRAKAILEAANRNRWTGMSDSFPEAPADVRKGSGIPRDFLRQDRRFTSSDRADRSYRKHQNECPIRRSSLFRPVPSLDALGELAMNLGWSWNHRADALWRSLDSELWELTRHPNKVLNTVSRETLDRSLADPSFCLEVDRLIVAKRARETAPAWFQKTHPDSSLTCAAYFSMEYMLTAALPIYSGGLGNVAGDQHKAASDLGVPVVGVGLLYQHGYFRQVIDRDGAQQALYPYNDPAMMPITPVLRKGTANCFGWR